MTASDVIRTVTSRCKRVIPGAAREAIRYHLVRTARLFHRRKFTVGDDSFPYLFHDYNNAWQCERAVEVPFVAHHLERCSGQRILEVGNVLSHYQSVRHEIVDKYEAAPGVTNVDVVELVAGPRYDLIISISTLEHVGWDEPVRNPRKILAAIATLRACLAPRGILLATLPFGYNPEVDRLIRERLIQFEVEHYLRRDSAFNDWREVDRDTAMACRYGQPYVGANGVLFGLTRGQS